MVFEEYSEKRDHYCLPQLSDSLMTATTLSDARTECSENVNCHMFYDVFGFGDSFYACENTASIKGTEWGSILYQKQGNNLHTHI